MFKRIKAGVKRLLFVGVAAGVVAGVVSLSFPNMVYADNQVIMRNIGTSDPAPMVYNGRMYFYCTEDAVGGGDLTIRTIGCYSTADMYHWSNRSEVLNESRISWCTRAGNLWAPHCCYLGGTFHLYFPEIAGSNFRIGHSTCSTPDGSFSPDGNYMTAVTGNALDPNVILDTSSRTAWLIWNIVWITPNHTYIQALNSSYNNVTGTRYELTNQMGQSTGTYKEGPWMVKRGSTYYFYYADWVGPERIGLSTSTSMTSGFRFIRYVMGSNSNSATIHPGFDRFNGQDYLFWHCGGNEFGGSVVSGTKRVTGCEWTTIGSTTSKTYRGVGVPGVGDSIQIDRRSSSSGVSITTNGVGYKVSSISNGGWVRYDRVNFSGCRSVSARVSATNSNNSIEIRLGSSSGTLLGTLPIPSTGNLNTYVTTSETGLTSSASGEQNLCCVFRMSSSNTMNVSWIMFGGTAIGEPAKSAPVQASEFVCRRMNRNTFRVSLPEGVTISEVKLYNLKGQEAVKLNTNNKRDNVTVNLAEETLAAGSYILKVKSSRGAFEHPFVY